MTQLGAWQVCALNGNNEIIQINSDAGNQCKDVKIEVYDNSITIWATQAETQLSMVVLTAELDMSWNTHQPTNQSSIGGINPIKT